MFRPSSPNLPETDTTEIRPYGVLVVTPYYPAHGGGPERIAGALTHEIELTANVHFTWAASDCDTPPDLYGPAMLPMKAHNFMENWLGLRYPFWSRNSLKQLKDAVKKADCVWLHDTLSPGCLAAARMARKLKKPIFVTQHASPTLRGNAWKRGWRTALDFIASRLILKQARQATFTSDTAAEFYYRRVAFKAPVKIIPNGVDCGTFQPCLPEKRAALRGRFSLRDNQPVMLFAGDFTEANGLLMLKELAQLLPAWRFWLVGKGRINPESWYLPNVQVFPKRCDATLAELYQSADLLVLPGHGKQFPLAAQEALACGLPVMCSSAVAAAQPFAKPYMWVIDSNAETPEQLAKVWAKKLKSAQQFLPLSEAKTELSDVAQSNWEWPRIASHYVELLRAISPAA
ncbi:MAG TPA: glycosyltransferase family 4 protein [Alphaproteobacteria bacterium]|nr:glycosyltransferase family 4 protein [Alphaproteobacteria bacterium]